MELIEDSLDGGASMLDALVNWARDFVNDKEERALIVASVASSSGQSAPGRVEAPSGEYHEEDLILATVLRLAAKDGFDSLDTVR